MMKIIDTHTHGIGGFDTAAASEEDILKIAGIHGNYGIAEIVPAIYPSSIDNMRENMHAVRKAMELQESEVRSQESEAGGKEAGARIIGLNLEGPFLNPSRCGALDARSFLAPDESDLKKLVEGFEDIIKIMTIAPELENAPKLIRAVSDMGIIVSMGHSDATYAEAEQGFHSGARGITHIFNAMRGIHHREPGLAGFGLMNKDIYIEVIADPFHLDPNIIEFIFSVRDHDRIIIVSDTVKETKTKDALKGVTNGQGRLLGGSMTIKESSDRLIRSGLDKEAVLKAVTVNPEMYLKEAL